MSTPQKADMLSRVSVTACLREPALRSATMSPSMSTVVQRWRRSKAVSGAGSLYSNVTWEVRDTGMSIGSG